MADAEHWLQVGILPCPAEQQAPIIDLQRPDVNAKTCLRAHMPWGKKSFTRFIVHADGL